MRMMHVETCIKACKIIFEIIRCVKIHINQIKILKCVSQQHCVSRTSAHECKIMVNTSDSQAYQCVKMLE